jgi:cell division septation protein DedD
MKMLGLVPLVGLIAAGCSDKKKEAARLEQEMREMEQRSADSAALVQDTIEDSLAVTAGDVDAVPEEWTADRMMPRRPSGSGFTVQVASCEDEGYARYLVDLYTERGFEPFVETYSGTDQVYHRVRIGLFETKAEADQLKEQLNDSYSIDPWVSSI